jgi:YD repeat-containing protein
MKKINLFLLVLLFVSTQVKAQSEQYSFNTPSPNASSMGTYGTIPVSYFTGTPNIEVPIYKIVEDNITIPISLSYHTANVKVNAHPGWVGLGWTLNAGGVITRKVNEVPDEFSYKYAENEDRGYYWHPGRLDNEEWSDTDNLNRYMYTLVTTGEEVCSDDFSFNFLGYSGKFYLDPKGKWQVISEHDIKVVFDEENDMAKPGDIDDRITDRARAEKLSESYFYRFTLITSNGVKYVFGGDKAIEYSVDYRNQSRSLAIPMSWYLTKIELPSGRDVTFTYDYINPDDFDSNYGVICNLAQGYYGSFKAESHEIDDIYNNPLEEYSQALLSKIAKYLSMDRGIHCSEDYSPDVYRPANGSLIFPVYLEKIEFSNGEVEFERSGTLELEYDKYDLYPDEYYDNYDLDENKFYYYLNSSSSSMKWCKLDVIKIKNKNETSPLKIFQFQYTNDENTRLKLLSLSEKSGNIKETKRYTPKYQFEYNETPLPKYCTDKIDHWGYYNNNNLGILPDLELYSDLRVPDKKYMTAEMLYKIIYPTGGETTFIFEPNKYSQVVSANREELEDENEIGGGVRISSIINKPSEAPKSWIRKKFFYVKSYQNQDEENISSMQSSGILGRKNKYYWPDYSGTAYFGLKFKHSVFSSNNLLPYNSSSNIVEYSEVIEKDYDYEGKSNGFKKYTYTSYDLDIWGDKHMDKLAENYSNPDRGIYSPYTSKDIERGKLTSVEVFSDKGKPLKQTLLKYAKSNDNYIPRINIDYNKLCSEFKFTHSDRTLPLYIIFATAYKTYTYNYNLTYKKEVSFDETGQNPVTIITNYEYYPEHNFLKSKEIDFGNNKKETTNYTYPFNYIPEDSDESACEGTEIYKALCEMKKKRMLNFPVEIINREVGKAPKFASLTIYKKFSDIIKPFEKYSYKLGSSELIQENLFSGSEVDLTYFQKEVSFDKYDTYGNLLQYHNKDNINTSIIWGYNHTLPVAKIVNSDYNSTIESKSNEIQTKTGSNLETRLNTLRDDLTDALVSTYTYEPLIGMKTQTDPNNFTTYYYYDDYERLITVKDNDEHIIKHNEYHYGPLHCSIDNYTFTANGGGPVSVVVYSDDDEWEIKETAEWLTIVTDEDKKYFNISCKFNEGGARSTTIKVIKEDYIHKIKIKQQANVVVVDPSEYTFEYDELIELEVKLSPFDCKLEFKEQEYEQFFEISFKEKDRNESENNVIYRIKPKQVNNLDGEIKNAELKAYVSGSHRTLAIKQNPLYHYISGKVYASSESKNPLRNITFLINSETVTTDNEGNYRFALTPGTTINMEAVYNNIFTFNTIEINDINENINNKDFICNNPLSVDNDELIFTVVNTQYINITSISEPTISYKTNVRSFNQDKIERNSPIYRLEVTVSECGKDYSIKCKAEGLSKTISIINKTIQSADIPEFEWEGGTEEYCIGSRTLIEEGLNRNAHFTYSQNNRKIEIECKKNNSDHDIEKQLNFNFSDGSQTSVTVTQKVSGLINTNLSYTGRVIDNNNNGVQHNQITITYPDDCNTCHFQPPPTNEDGYFTMQVIEGVEITVSSDKTTTPESITFTPSSSEPAPELIFVISSNQH